VPTRDADVRLVADFVRRLRRVALHPLALEGPGGDDDDDTPLPGPYLCKLMTFGGTAEVGPDRLATIRSPLPDEVQFESLATRVRTFTLERDRLNWAKVVVVGLATANNGPRRTQECWSRLVR
jgi:hypothetical protein